MVIFLRGRKNKCFLLVSNSHQAGFVHFHLLLGTRNQNDTVSLWEKFLYCYLPCYKNLIRLAMLSWEPGSKDFGVGESGLSHFLPCGDPKLASLLTPPPTLAADSPRSAKELFVRCHIKRGSDRVSFQVCFSWPWSSIEFTLCLWAFHWNVVDHCRKTGSLVLWL